MKRRFLILAAVVSGFMAASALLGGDAVRALGWLVACIALAVLAEKVPS